MAQRKELITIAYHYDSDTGLYKIGELECGISGEMDNYIEKYGKDILLNYMDEVIKRIEEY